MRLLVLVVLAGTLTSALFHFLAAWVGDLPNTQVVFLFSNATHGVPLGDSFADLINPLATAEFSRDQGGGTLVPPLQHVVYLLASLLGQGVSLAVQAGAFLVVFSLLVWRLVLGMLPTTVERATGLIVLVGLSYPVLFVLERGNSEMLLFLVIAGFLYTCYVRESPWCVAFLAVAIALKLYPAVFLVLLLADRRYRWCLSTVLASACISLGSLLLLALTLHRDYSELVRSSAAVLESYSATYAQRLEGLPYGHSLWGLLIWVAGLFGVDQGAFAARALPVYTFVGGVLLVLVAVAVILRVRLLWQRVALVTVAALALPSVSADYRLLYAYFPLAFLLNTPSTTRIDRVCLVLFGVLLVPLDYVYGVVLMRPGWIADHASTSVVVYPLVLLAIAALVLWDTFSTPGEDTGGREAESALPWESG